ncbi:thyroid hormone receptor-associated protein 3 [Sigmodon hispidus]
MSHGGHGPGAFPRSQGWFMFWKSSTSPKWSHDKFSVEEGEAEDDEYGTENREEKDNLQPTLDGALAQGRKELGEAGGAEQEASGRSCVSHPTTTRHIEPYNSRRTLATEPMF